MKVLAAKGRERPLRTRPSTESEDMNSESSVRTPSIAFVWLLLFVVTTGAGRAASRPPEWLAAALVDATPADPSREATILLDDLHLHVSSEGVLSKRIRYAVEIRTHEGRSHAVAIVPYFAKTSRVKSLRAWIINSQGTCREIPKGQHSDVAYFSAVELYGDRRAKRVNASAEPNLKVFAYEAIVESNSLLGEVWSFQDELPVKRSSFSVELAKGWTARALSFDGAPDTPALVNGTRAWEMRSLPPLATEENVPASARRLPLLAIDLFGPAGKRLQMRRLSFDSWLEISEYFSSDYESAANVVEPLLRQADALLPPGNGLKETLTRFAGFAQKVNYVSLTFDSEYGGGMKPRPAAEILRVNYGDCKDKTTLLKALLATRGIQSFPVIVYFGSDREIRSEWPSPMQFNHCILAISVGSDVVSDAVVVHPTLGRLLVFDPTDEHTPFGTLADADLAPQGLLLAGSQGGLIELPKMKRQDRIVRKMKAVLDEKGHLKGSIEEVFYGHDAIEARRDFSRDDNQRLRNKVTSWLRGAMTTPEVTRAEIRDEFVGNQLTLMTEFVARGQGRWMQRDLLAFKAAVAPNRGLLSLDREKRIHPVSLRAGTYSEYNEIEMPASFFIEEKASPVVLTTPFGTYESTVSVSNGLLVFSGHLKLREMTVSKEDYPALLQFFDEIRAAEQNFVVLRRKDSAGQKTP